MYFRHSSASSAAAPALTPALETLDLAGRKVIQLVRDPELALGPLDWSSGRACLTGGRLIYSLREPFPHNLESNLWELRINSRTGHPAGTPRKLTHWSGINIEAISASAEGKILSILKENVQTDVYISELEANGTRLKTPRRLTLDERFDWPGPWMPDSKAIVFTSNRNGTWDLFKQAIHQPSAELLVSGPDVKIAKAVTPDGTWLLYASQNEKTTSAQMRLMRIPIQGGPSEPVIGVGAFEEITCAKRPPSTACAFVNVGKRGWTFSKYDLQTRERREFANVEHAVDWDLFFDGSRIAVLINTGTGSRIRIVRLTGELEREFAVGGLGIETVYCSADGKGLYLATAPYAGTSTLLYTDLLGKVQVAWQGEGNFGGAVYASPDGRYLSITRGTKTNDAWLMENF